MGLAGPPPKRDAERRRTNERELPTTTVNVAELSSGDVVIPLEDENWHPVAKRVWRSFPQSASSVLLEPSDWALLYVGCDDLSRELKPKHVQVGVDGAGDPIFVQREMPMPGAKLNALLKLMGNLLATEGDRRRLAIEVNRGAHKEAGEQIAGADRVALQRKKRAAG
jgi:hypothetical protein